MKTKIKIFTAVLLFSLAIVLYNYSSDLLQHNNAILVGAGTAVITNTDWLVKLTALLSGALLTGTFAVLIWRGE